MVSNVNRVRGVFDEYQMAVERGPLTIVVGKDFKLSFSFEKCQNGMEVGEHAETRFFLHITLNSSYRVKFRFCTEIKIAHVSSFSSYPGSAWCGALARARRSPQQHFPIQCVGEFV